MPELPEVETVRRDLEKEVVGRRIKAVAVDEPRLVRRHADPAEFVERLQGRQLTGVERRGKYLVLRLGDDDVLVVHLGMSGQLLKAAVKDARPKHTHVVLTFTQGGELRYVDPRTFGELFVTPAATLDVDVPEIGDLGFDPIEAVMSWQHFAAMLLTRKVRLKALLMDQKVVAGIGNIYSDEILWNAGLRYDRSSDTLSSQEIRRLYRAIGEVLHEAVKKRGSSLADQQYRDLYGNVGEYQHEHRVYAREGLPCSRCRTPVVRERWSGRSTFFCPQCQV